MNQAYIDLKHQLQSGGARTELASECSPEALDLLVAIAVAASDEEWQEFAEEDFSLDAIPPILLTSSQMQMLRGGSLPTPGALIGRLSKK